jgi:hypothetical protein
LKQGQSGQGSVHIRVDFQLLEWLCRLRRYISSAAHKAKSLKISPKFTAIRDLLWTFSFTPLPLPSFHKNRGMVTTVEVETKFRVSKTKTQ